MVLLIAGGYAAPLAGSIVLRRVIFCDSPAGWFAGGKGMLRRGFARLAARRATKPSCSSRAYQPTSVLAAIAATTRLAQRSARLRRSLGLRMARPPVSPCYAISDRLRESDG